jgi:hypothetical protein
MLAISYEHGARSSATHEISGPKSEDRRSRKSAVGSSTRHTAEPCRPALRSGEASVGQWVVSIYVVKKGHARDIYFLLQTRNFWYSSAPPPLSLSLYVVLSAIYSPVPFIGFIGCIGSSHMELRSGRSAYLRGLRWCSIERLGLR